jgi:hypothetical protein
MELSLPSNVDRAFKEKVKKALLKISYPLRSLELSLPDNINRAFKGKLRKPYLRYPVL